MKNLTLSILALLFTVSVQGQSSESQFENLPYNSQLLINTLILSSFSNQLDNSNEFKKWKISKADLNMANSNNPYLSPLQMVNNSTMWCPQPTNQSTYFVDQVVFKTYRIGNLKMNTNYVYDLQGNLRSTSTNFGD